ncbi:diguanylate cyclase [Eubacteriaceae bacterium ES2]|nr:diguanylate cyclase [Eubacteriaceae bacterium ES2]
MKTLSILSYSVFVMFVILGAYSLKLNFKQPLNRAAFYECLALSIWAFAYTFFFGAPAQTSAMFWHRIGFIGGSLFPPFAIYFFMILTTGKSLLKHTWQKTIFWGIPCIILFKNLFGKTTCLALGFVQSTSGLGWTYFNTPQNLWTWFYLLMLGAYFTFGFILLYKWQHQSNYEIQKRQAIFIIFVDSIILIIGATTDIIMPMFDNHLPPIAVISTILFAAAFASLITQYQLFSFSTMASSDTILETVSDPVILLDENGMILRYNQATCNLLKYDRYELIGRGLNSLLKSKEYNQKSLDLLKADRQFKRRETKLLTSSQQIIDAVISASVASDDIDGFMGIVITLHDISNDKRIEKELVETRESFRKIGDELYLIANFDSLTGLANRRAFFLELEVLKKCYSKGYQDFAVIFMDLNNFKAINDQYGHAIGDQVLIHTANRLNTQKSQHELISRMGGDEFTILLRQFDSEIDILQKKQLIKELFDVPIIISNYQFKFNISVGYALYSQSSGDSDLLIRNADQMMYRDKRKEKAFL